MCWMVPDLEALREYSARNCSGRAATGGLLGMPQLHPATSPRVTFDPLTLCHECLQILLRVCVVAMLTTVLMLGFSDGDHTTACCIHLSSVSDNG